MLVDLKTTRIFHRNSRKNESTQTRPGETSLRRRPHAKPHKNPFLGGQVRAPPRAQVPPDKVSARRAAARAPRGRRQAHYASQLGRGSQLVVPPNALALLLLKQLVEDVSCLGRRLDWIPGKVILGTARNFRVRGVTIIITGAVRAMGNVASFCEPESVQSAFQTCAAPTGKEAPDGSSWVQKSNMSAWYTSPDPALGA